MVILGGEGGRIYPMVQAESARLDCGTGGSACSFLQDRRPLSPSSG